MKVIIDINHPAHVHFFKNLIWKLKEMNIEVIVTSTTKEISERLLDKYGIKYINLGKYRSKLFFKFIDFLKIGIKYSIFCYKNKPDYILSISSARPFGRLVSKAKFFVFTDTEHAKEQIALFKPFATKIFTPDCFLDDLGSKQVRYNGYHELAYLHPNRFTPNPEVLKEIGLTEKDKFFIVRFVSWDASHDVGQKGLSLEDKRKLTDTLKPHGKIIISSEKELPAEFEEYRMKICPTKMHDLLYYATMYIGEGGTMASEAACLGTYSIYINPLEMGYTNEERDKYRLIYQSTNINNIIEHFNDLDLKKLKVESKVKMKFLLSDKIDVTQYIVDYFEKDINK